MDLRTRTPCQSLYNFQQDGKTQFLIEAQHQLGLYKKTYCLFVRGRCIGITAEICTLSDIRLEKLENEEI